MIATSPPSAPIVAGAVSSASMPMVTLRGRRQAVRRRRLVLRMRDWLGVTVIACFAATLFAVTFFSLAGR